MPKRSLKGKAGRLALIHSLAHIELNAVDLTWDLIGRFAHVRLPRSYYDDWVRVGLEEAKHFAMLQERLAKLDATYGDLLPTTVSGRQRRTPDTTLLPALPSSRWYSRQEASTSRHR